MYEKELMTIVLAVKKWQHYLTEQTIIIKTDQRALKFLLEQRILAPDQKKWVTKLMGFKFEIKYKPGKENRAADALSRCEHELEVQALSVWQYEGMAELEEEIERDDQLRKVKQQILLGQNNPRGYELKKGILFLGGRLVLPRSSPKLQALISEFHDSLMGGHSGFLKTYKRVASVAIW